MRKKFKKDKIIVNCDKCTKNFEVKKIKKKKVGTYGLDEIRFNYFECKHCKEKYFTGVDERVFNEFMEKFRNNLNEILKLKNAKANIEKIVELQEENKRLNKKAKERTEILKENFSEWK